MPSFGCVCFKAPPRHLRQPGRAEDTDAQEAPLLRAPAEEAPLLRAPAEEVLTAAPEPAPESEEHHHHNHHHHRAGACPRVVISGSPQCFELQDEGTQVVLLGGNYVLKAQPWFPPEKVVARNAKSMAEGLRASGYVPGPDPRSGRPRVARPCVRLGATFSGAMPSKAMHWVDASWAAALEATIQAFAEEGVYVFLDNHQDNMCPTNGGQGIPWWVAAHFQDTAGCGCFSASWSCCWGSAWSRGVCEPSYIAHPDHPLMDVCCNACPGLLSKLLPTVQTVASDPEAPEHYWKDPWRAYAPGCDAGDPAHMHIANVNMRMNNDDPAQARGGPQFTLQSQNVAYRLYRSYDNEVDRTAVFEPYMTFVKYLCSLYDKYPNVVAVELLNEPNTAGLPNPFALLNVRRDLYSFFGAVLEELDAAPCPVRCPVVIDDLASVVPNTSTLYKVLGCVPLPDDALTTLRMWAERRQLVWSFHYYPSIVMQASVEEAVATLRQSTEALGDPPIFLSEIQHGHESLELAARLGVDATTYWHYVDTEYVAPNFGWFRYSDEILELCARADPPMTKPIGDDGRVCWPAWEAFVETVEDGTAWGGYLNGSAGGEKDVLEKLGS